MAVRTATIAFASPLAGGVGWQTLYTVPAGRTVIIKDVRVMNGSGAAKTVGVGVRHSSGGQDVALLIASIAGSSTGALSQGFVVLEPGDSIRGIVVEASPTQCHAWISGSILDGVAE